MSHLTPFRLGGQNLQNELSSTGSNPKKRKKNVQLPAQPSPVQDLLPPPLSGYGDTVVASNPFDDCPNTMNSINLRNHGPMGMGGGVPVNMNNLGMGCRTMGPGPGMNPMMHGNNSHPNSHMLNNPMMMGNPRMNGPMGNHVGSHIIHPNNSMHNVSGPLHSPMSLTGPGPMSGGMGGTPVNSPQMNGPMPGNMNMNASNGPIGPPDNNNFMMSPINSIYSKPMPVSAGKIYPADQPMVFNSQNPNAPPIYPCGVCHKEVHDNDQAILCESGCNFWFHRGCTGLTETAFQLLTAEVYAEWVCDKCLSTKTIPLVKFKP